ncbi:unnamed protein product [Parnassius mnemosyne]|uniref:Peptidase aspartic putative domain-containing protein n=1 Tax=Parnassius mnemosyne TaxID=213953 RepID=A0AAV1L815_9NEOP
MEGLINVLKDQQNVITKGLTNFKKCGKDRLTIEYVETRQELLEKDWALFKENNTKLYERFKAEDISQRVVDIYDATEDTYIVYKSLMKTTLNTIRSAKDSLNQANTSSTFNKSSSSFVKLPKISIPTFSGKYDEWTTFHDLFTSLVHNNESLDNVQRLHYLKSHLSGEAEQLIRHTPVTDANYIQCWNQLQKRYNNKKYLTNCILKRLFNQKRMQVESSTALKELLDTTCDCLNALNNLGINVSTWDVIIIHIVSFKLDNETRKQWELSVGNNDSSNDLPTFNQFKAFIENRFRALECLDPKRVPIHQSNNVNKASIAHSPKAMLTTSSSMRCEFCLEGHKLCFCKKFSKQTVEARRDFVIKHKICFNCLGGNHMVSECRKPTTCKVCQRRHHSLLHIISQESDKRDQPSTASTVDSVSSPNAGPIVSCLSIGNTPKPRQVLLATALIKAESRSGDFQMVRALLDQGSQACFITEAVVQLLNLKKIPIQGTISGLGGNSSTKATYMVRLNIKSRVDPVFSLTVNAYVLNKITSYLPEYKVHTTLDWLSVNTLQLADPEFNTPNKIDVLLGADAYSCIIKAGIVKSPSGTLIAQSTTLGWVLSGAVSRESSTKINVLHAQLSDDELLRRFWEIEEQNSSKKILTPEEKKCEELYSKTTIRDVSGRYVVRLPFREENPSCKGCGSRAIAERRFKSLEKRLGRDVDLKERYKQVIEEYLQLGHMRKIDKRDKNRDAAVYLPHHAVIREDKTTSKVRVVFNASEKNNNGVSLNDTLMVGPTLQSDLRHTVLRWRFHPIALVADIVKMYRQVRISDEDAMFQRVLWRDSSEIEIEDYELVTVTFGTASAPYQAVRTLHQVAYDEGHNYTVAADKILNCFYMDDLMTGCNDVEEGLEIHRQMTDLLGKGGFALQKWNSNNQDIVNKIQDIESNILKGQIDQNRTKDNKDNTNNHNIIQDIKSIEQYKPNKSGNKQNEVEIKLDSTIKILGLTWNRNADCFQYTVNLPMPTTAPVTKRAIISVIARLFDPLGWLAPSMIIAKVFIQKLWLAGVDWDQELTDDLINEWIPYREELILLTKVRIPRWLGTKSNDYLELHGFSDASKNSLRSCCLLASCRFRW